MTAKEIINKLLNEGNYIDKYDSIFLDKNHHLRCTSVTSNLAEEFLMNAADEMRKKESKEEMYDVLRILLDKINRANIESEVRCSAHAPA